MPFLAQNMECGVILLCIGVLGRFVILQGINLSEYQRKVLSDPLSPSDIESMRDPRFNFRFVDTKVIALYRPLSAARMGWVLHTWVPTAGSDHACRECSFGDVTPARWHIFYFNDTPTT